MFAIILATCFPSDLVMLWNEHATQFVTDIRNRHLGPSGRTLEADSVAKSYVLLKIQQFLKRLHGGSLIHMDYRFHQKT